MNITNKQLLKLLPLLEARAGKKITMQEALSIGTELLNLVKLIYKPIKTGKAKPP